MSVPYAPPGYIDILSALEKLGINDFYLQYFQKPGVPEAELQQDIRGALRRLYFTAGGELQEKGKGFARLTDGSLLGNTVDPPTLPAWLSEADLDYYTQEFSRTGFRGGLNWYRNLPAQLGAGRAVARPADPPALLVHRRQPRRRAALSRRAVAARRLSQDSARPRRQPHHRGRRPLGAAGSAGRRSTNC